MSAERSGPALNRQIVDEAAEWFVEINEGEADFETRQRFLVWLTASPEHIRAYLRILPDWQDGERVGPSPQADAGALIAWARGSGNIVPLTSSAGDGGARAESTRRASRNGRWLRALSVAAAVALVALGLIWFLTTEDSYATGIGEQRFIALDDGTTVELNARSRLQVRFSETERRIDLVEGQALFHVAKDPHRTFVVDSGNTVVRAVGTQFDVYRKRSGTVVTVVEGKVSVSSTTSEESQGVPPAPALLVAGEQITVAPSARSLAKPADVALATAWTKRHLAFFRTPLPEVAEEFNRYNKRQLVIKDRRLDTFNVSGTFSSTDPAALIRFLRIQPGFAVSETSSTIEVSFVPSASP